MAAEEKWYFSKEQLANSPSRKCGLDADKELSYRQQAANFIQDMGQKLQVTQLCINTAIVYMHRFYVFHSFTHFNRNAIAAAALFLAAKVEEQPRKLEHVIRIAHACLHREQPHLDTKSEQYLDQAQDLVFNENVLLQTLGFDVAIDHPHTHVVRCSQLVRASKDLAQTSYIMASNSLHLTTMCLQYKPTFVACLCIYLACKWAGMEIPQSNEGKDWFWYVDKTVTLEQLEQVTSEFLTIFDKCPTKLKKKINSITASQNASLGQSVGAAGSPFDKEPRRIRPAEGIAEIMNCHPRHHSHVDSKSAPPRFPVGNAEDSHKKHPQPTSGTSRHSDPSQVQRIDYRDYREKKERERLEKEKAGNNATNREIHQAHSSSSSHHKTVPNAVPSKASLGNHRPSNNMNARDVRREQHLRDVQKRDNVPRSGENTFTTLSNINQEQRDSSSEISSDLSNHALSNIKRDMSEWGSESDSKHDKVVHKDSPVRRIHNSESSRHNKFVGDQNRINMNNETRVRDVSSTDQRQPFINRPDRPRHRNDPVPVEVIDKKHTEPLLDRHEAVKKHIIAPVSGHMLPIKREIKQEKVDEVLEYKSQISQALTNVPVVKHEIIVEKTEEGVDIKSQNMKNLTNINLANSSTNKIRSKSPSLLTVSNIPTHPLIKAKSPNSISIGKPVHSHHNHLSPYNVINDSGHISRNLLHPSTSVVEEKQGILENKVVKRPESHLKHHNEFPRRSEADCNQSLSNSVSKVSTPSCHKPCATSTPEKSSSHSVRESPVQRSSKSRQRTSPSKKVLSADITPPVSGFSTPPSSSQIHLTTTPNKSGISTTPSSVKSSRHRTSSSGSEPELVPVVKKLDEIAGYENIIRDAKIKIPGRVPDIIPPIRDRKKDEFNVDSSCNSKHNITDIKEHKPLEICRLLQQNVEQHQVAKSSDLLSLGMVMTSENELFNNSGRQSADLNTSSDSFIDVTSLPETCSDTLITASSSSSVLLRCESPKRTDHHHKSEKKKKKEKHKHKEKDKTRDREDREKKHKDKHKPKHKDRERDREKEYHRSEKYVESVPSSAPIKITIPKDKLNLSQTLEANSSLPLSSGLKLKIQKDRLVGSDSTGNSPQMTPSGSLKIKISKDAIGGFSNNQVLSESKKRERSPSLSTDYNIPPVKTTKLDVPLPKPPKMESSRSRSTHSKPNGIESSSIVTTSTVSSLSSRGRSSQQFPGTNKVRGSRGRGRPPQRGHYIPGGGGVGAGITQSSIMSFNYPPPYYQTFPPPTMVPQQYNMYPSEQLYSSSDQMYSTSDQMYSAPEMYGYYSTPLQQDMSQYMYQVPAVDHNQQPPLPKGPPPDNFPPLPPPEHLPPPPPPPPQ